MTSPREILHFLEETECKVMKVRISEGWNITPGQLLISCEQLSAEEQQNGQNGVGKHPHLVRSTAVGLVEKVLVKDGDILKNGSPILEYSICTHPTVMKDMCAECGADLRETKIRTQTAAVAMVHSIPELMVSMPEAISLGKADEGQLLKDRRLVLLVDLDQTLIHTTNDDIPPNIEDVFHFQLHGCHSQWYHTRFRPYTREFLENMHALYQLHICTFGSRTYAHTIARLLDKEGRYFDQRILSRDECFSAHSKTANLKALFPCGDHMVVIIDDREDVWNFAPNLIHVRPYHFFQHTGDINAPPGLAKREKDEKEGFDFATMQNSNTPKEFESKSDTPIDIKPPAGRTDEANENTEGGVEKDLPNESSESRNIVTNDVLDEDKKQVECTTSINMDDPPSDISEKIEPNDTKVMGKSEDTPELTREGEARTERSSAEKKDNLAQPENSEEPKIHINDTDDYLLYLQEILRTIHHAYYEMYDNCMKSGETNPIPDMKIVLPYVRRKVLENVRVVFSGLIPTNAKLDKSRPYLVAKSLGAIVEDKITEKTTHLVAARLGTSKLFEAKNSKHIKIVTPEWLWTCAERWEHVDERLYPLTSDAHPLRRKPPAHCTSPDVALQLAMRTGSKDHQETDGSPVYDRVTGKRIRRATKTENETPVTDASVVDSSFTETVNPLLSLSSDDIADMDREVEDIMEDNDTDGGASDDDEEIVYPVESKEPEEEEPFVDDFEEPPSRKRKREETDHLLIGYVNDPDDPENESLDAKFRRGEGIPRLDGEEPDDIDNEAEIEDLEQEEEPEDSEWCLAGQALEREFLSEED